jgi:putative transposase
VARPLRIEFPGALYHVTSRGNAREAIVRDDADRQMWLAVLGEVLSRGHWLCHAYCLMDNHYHLLVETPEADLSYGMRQLNGVYTQRFNRQHGRVGHVFQGRFKAILVERDSYLLELSRYIVLNPVRARMVTHPKRYPCTGMAHHRLGAESIRQDPSCGTAPVCAVCRPGQTSSLALERTERAGAARH